MKAKSNILEFRVQREEVDDRLNAAKSLLADAAQRIVSENAGLVKRYLEFRIAIRLDFHIWMGQSRVHSTAIIVQRPLNTRRSGRLPDVFFVSSEVDNVGFELAAHANDVEVLVDNVSLVEVVDQGPVASWVYFKRSDFIDYILPCLVDSPFFGEDSLKLLGALRLRGEVDAASAPIVCEHQINSQTVKGASEIMKKIPGDTGDFIGDTLASLYTEFLNALGCLVIEDQFIRFAPQELADLGIKLESVRVSTLELGI